MKNKWETIRHYMGSKNRLRKNTKAVGARMISLQKQLALHWKIEGKNS